MKRSVQIAFALAALFSAVESRAADVHWERIAPLFQAPAELAGKFGSYAKLSTNQAAIRGAWEKEIGVWPPPIEKPRIEFLSRTNRETFLQQRVKVEIGQDEFQEGWLLTPSGRGPFPAVLVVYYEPETSIGLSTNKLRDFAYQLAKRGFVALAIGSPGGDARKPDTKGVPVQPLHYLGYVAGNCANALASLPKVDARRIGIVGHSYGGKWAMFAAAFNPRFACGVWSDPGIVFDDTRANINYWEPWYLGAEEGAVRKAGLPTKENPATGAYARLRRAGHDLTEVLALMAPRPFLVSGGSEDPPDRWLALNRVNEVYQALGATNRVAMSNRPRHDPTPESNADIYAFFEHFLR